MLGKANARIILGGPHITNVSNSHTVNQFPGVTVFVRGDGEFVVYELLKGTDPSHIPGTFTPANSSRHITTSSVITDLSELPIIDRRFSHGEPFRRLNKDWYGMTVSRGCLFKCSFCAGSSWSSGIRYRTTPFEQISEEVAYLRELGASGIRLFDDLPFRGKRALLQFLTQVRSRFGTSLSWEVNFPLQYCMSLNDEDWQTLAENNIRTLIFGVEAADPELRASLGKRAEENRLWSVINASLRWNIGLRLYFIIGTPGEPAESTDRTVSLAKRLATIPVLPGLEGIRCSLFAYKPMPGSKLWTDLTSQHYNESELLQYVDFELSVSEFQKHAWRSKLKLSELTPEELSLRIDDFYSVTEKTNSDSMTGMWPI